MFFLIFVVILIIVISYIWKNNLVIRWDSLFKKGFHKKNDKYGLYCFCGVQGSGKTLSVLHLIEDLYSLTNRKIITNVESYYKNNKDKCIYNDNIYDIIDKFNNLEYKRDYILFYDEIFSCFEKNHLPKKARTFLCQMRKRGIYVITTCQYWLDLDPSFRRFVRYQVDCKMFNFLYFGPAMSINEINDGYQMHWDNFVNNYVSPRLKTTVKKCSKKIADSYDTEEIIKEV